MALVLRDWTDFQELVRRMFEGDVDKSWLRVEEFMDDKTMVVRAELPDIDPDKDVEVAIVDGELRIKAELAYEINHISEGFYSVVKFQAERDAIEDLDRVLTLADDVVRHKIVRAA